MGIVEGMVHFESPGPIESTNRICSEERSRRFVKENCDVVLSKYKRHEVAAVRDFPSSFRRVSSQIKSRPSSDGATCAGVPSNSDVHVTTEVVESVAKQQAMFTYQGNSKVVERLNTRFEEDSGLTGHGKSIEHDTSDPIPSKETSQSSLKTRLVDCFVSVSNSGGFRHRRRVSAVRNFPSFCSRDDPLLSKKVYVDSRFDDKSLNKVASKCDKKKGGNNRQRKVSNERLENASKRNVDEVQADSKLMHVKESRDDARRKKGGTPYPSKSNHVNSKSDRNVSKFRSNRIPKQPEIACKEVKKLKKIAVQEGLFVDDISQGKECYPISAVNTVDDETPQPFTYITRIMYPDWYSPVPPKGCDCSIGCSNSCSCAVKNGGKLPYNYSESIVEAKPLVYECGPSCKCLSSCSNRVSQKGIKFQLQIFKTRSKGWGLRSLDPIPSGSFIFEYVGELLTEKEAEQRNNDEYLFDIGNNYNEIQASSSKTFTIDAAEIGNVGRFINHCCSPNLYAQNVLYDHEDKRAPHIMLFAYDTIPPLQELTFHYNYGIDQVRDSNGNILKKSCYCGSVECTGRMY